MAGQKNKTTHKHNFKIAYDEPMPNDYGLPFRVKREECLCGEWKVYIHLEYDFIYLPTDIMHDMGLQKPCNYKIEN